MSKQRDLLKEKTLKIIDECTEFNVGSCVGCNSTFARVASIEGMHLCDECLCRVRESVETLGDIGEFSLENIANVINEYVIFFDMEKMQKEADKNYNGNIKDMIKKVYNISPYAILPNKIDFQTSVFKQKKARLNQLIIDFDGEFTSVAATVKMTPDSDGTVAPLNVRGKGKVSPNAGTNPPPKIAKASLVDRELSVGKDKTEIIYVETNNTSFVFNIKGMYGAPDRNYSINKTVSDVDKELAQLIYANISDITNKKLKVNYKLTILGLDVEAILDIDSLYDKNVKDIKFILSWDNKNVVADKKDLFISISDVNKVLQDVQLEVENKLYSLNIIPTKFEHEICGVKFNLTKAEIQNDKYLLKLNNMDIFIDIKKFRKNSDSALLEIENNLKAIAPNYDASYTITLSNMSSGVDTYKANMVKGSSIKSNKLTYEIIGPKGYKKEVEIDSLIDISDKLKAIIDADVKSLTNVSGDGIPVSDSKKEILSKKASSKKELVLNDVASLIKKELFDNSIFVTVNDFELVGNTVYSISIKLTDSKGNLQDLALGAYYKEFKNTLKAKKSIAYEETNAGVDDSGYAFVEWKIKDKKFIKEWVSALKLDEFFNSMYKHKSLTSVFESVKRR